ncbi:hypothetical protein A2348_01495 [Candidatus Uhrbacteria bacterium RIFOXYB12_FULL_58_10]|uniref:Nudix hydrolase domain-containing protein n=1 Tax=Candidatus Uhrbacteria bacterium RIFOXYB2_FULL_57_15 TaxID=1802422 RepID=A0A1F7W791_9BACT|nr:MAG: hypothetical protein A2348_01495 [Candidatus Uhrbacteria bacterium RIFOXYB12_FULL_58_10]OGL98057.1 MAG: hypothetical protein A2304_00925 [Candidatus Uhrbacteria bacterium RIFOXYB2_FULL_57_15]OGL99736.1 MAG: hypothetical protein A2501_00265 [Candidatus Uhrbacteria bacterium RIFOXYC12_FULL_57_11]
MFNLIDTDFSGFLRLERWQKPGSKHTMLVVRTTDSVSGLLYDPANDRVCLVRQNRAPMVRDDNTEGLIVELIAGRFDRVVGAKALFVAEAKEEAGANIMEADVTLLNEGRPLAPSPGVLTERCILAFAEIREDQLDPGETFGVAAENERTHRVWMSTQEFLIGPHDDLRVYALARELECRLLRRPQHLGR